MKLISTIGLILITQIVFGQTKVERFDSLFNYLHKNQLINGNVLVAEKGNVIYQKSFGYLIFESEKLHTANSIFSVASITKVFTSLSILQLKEKGKLELDDYVKKHLPEFPYPDITVRNLLSHTSGLPDLDIFEEAVQNNPKKIFTNKDVLPLLIVWRNPLKHKPNEKWAYSNINYELLALIVENITGNTFQDYVRKNIFVPANMPNTFFKTDLVALKNKNRSEDYEYPTMYSSKPQNVASMEKFRWSVYNLSGTIGDGNLMSTTEDLLNFDKVLYTGKLINTSSLEEAFTPTKLTSGANADANIGIGKTSYGLGWFIFDDTSNGKVVWHSGGDPGALSIFLRNIDKKHTVILLDNTASVGLYENGVNAMNILNNKPIVPTKQSLAKEYLKTLAKQGGDAAFCRYIELQNDSLHYGKKRFEDEVNNCVFEELINDSSVVNNIEKSVDAFRLLVLLFPTSWNTYDSYAYALEKKGMYKEAILMYKKSLELSPKNDNAHLEIEKIRAKLK